jgi:C4-dicarboxylate transporter DctM subunit
MDIGLVLSIILLLILLAIGAPLYVAFALGGILILTTTVGFPIYNLSGIIMTSLNSWVLIACPLFLFAGYLTVVSGMAKDLVALLGSFTSRVPGGIGVGVVIAAAFVGAFTAEALPVIAIVGLVLYPAMIEAKYDRGFSAAIICSSAPLGGLIPPSIPLILYGFLTETSVARLFMAGILPGLMIALFLSITAIIIAKRKRFPVSSTIITWNDRKQLTIKAIPALLMPFIVLGGIYGGIFTPTEASAVCCVYILIVGMLIYRRLNFRDVWNSAKDTMRTMAMVLILLGSVLIFSKALMVLGLPRFLSDWVAANGLSSTGFLALLCVAFVIVGMAMDYFGMIAMVPIIVPPAIAAGIDPVHLGIVWCVAAYIGGQTPPVAGGLYFTAGFFKVPVVEVIRGIIPFLLISIVCLFIVALLPELSLWLPRVLLR